MLDINLKDKHLTNNEKKEIQKILELQNPEIADDVSQISYLADLIWDMYGCDNKTLNWEKIEKFYSHPLYILIGLFSEQHDVSLQHRKAISEWVVHHSLRHIVDYGGGIGVLAQLIAAQDKTTNIDIYEPYPSDFGLRRTKENRKINYVTVLNKNYDCLISIDVLEHVPDPLKTFSEMIDCVHTGGYLIIANNFYPVVKCHLPRTFHLRYSFDFFSKCMGLNYLGGLEGSHATIYRKKNPSVINWKKIRYYEKISKALYFFLDHYERMIRLTKNRVRVIVKYEYSAFCN
jgi:2-polyprenyl-3-methyl-5-hydroxy-6-metoxy-1,4-benzoquinol methylase